jgi:(p)ppGpp synthase/HD superfamily hydrolase
MRAWLDGRGYYIAADAMELVQSLEQGFRKDGITPKFHHQLSVARYVVTLAPHLLNPEETIAVAFLHDVLEDHWQTWSREMLERRFGKTIADAVWTISKKIGGMVKSYELYYGDIALCPIASIVKCADRNHNIQTMVGVFTLEKQATYVDEVEDYYYPMIKKARRAFKKQYSAYDNLKMFLRSQCRLIEANLEAHGFTGGEVVAT